MKNNLFGKATSLIMGSLMVFSGQGLAMKSSHQEGTNAEALGEVEVLIAQQEQQDLRVDTCAQAQADIEDALARLNADVPDGLSKDVAVDVLNLAKTLVGNAKAATDVEILSKVGAEVVFNVLNQAESKLGDAEADLRALIPVEGEDAKVAADLVNKAKTAVGDCQPIGFAIEKAE